MIPWLFPPTDYKVVYLVYISEVFGVIHDRKENPKEGSYTNYLFDKGLDKILKKLGEEATEIVIAAKNRNPEEVKYEIGYSDTLRASPVSRFITISVPSYSFTI